MMGPPVTDVDIMSLSIATISQCTGRYVMFCVHIRKSMGVDLFGKNLYFVSSSSECLVKSYWSLYDPCRMYVCTICTYIPMLLCTRICTYVHKTLRIQSVYKKVKVDELAMLGLASIQNESYTQQHATHS